MKRDMTINYGSKQSSNVLSTLMQIAQLLTMPILWLQQYYTECLREANEEECVEKSVKNEPITIKKTLHLLHIQIAFLFAAFGVTSSLFLHLVFIGWFVSLLLCKVD